MSGNYSHDTGNGTFSAIFLDLRDTRTAKKCLKCLRCVPQEHHVIEKVNSMYRDVIIPIWSSLSHKHISPFFAINCTEGSMPTIEIPYYEEGNIFDYNMRFPDADKMQQITEIAAGVGYLHSRNIRHANLCPTNVLIQNDGRVHISDPCLNFLMRQLMDDGYMSTPASYQYKAPEELLGATDISTKADIYSWACVVYEASAAF